MCQHSYLFGVARKEKHFYVDKTDGFFLVFPSRSPHIFRNYLRAAFYEYCVNKMLGWVGVFRSMNITNIRCQHSDHICVKRKNAQIIKIIIWKLVCVVVTIYLLLVYFFNCSSLLNFIVYRSFKHYYIYTIMRFANNYNAKFYNLC